MPPAGDVAQIKGKETRKVRGRAATAPQPRCHEGGRAVASASESAVTRTEAHVTRKARMLQCKARVEK